jgi:hypothetical protein
MAEPWLSVNGVLEFVMLLTIASIAVLFVMSLNELRGYYRAQLRCPVRLRPARVDFEIGPGSKSTDVLRCSIFGRRPITCGKACLPQAA